MNVVKNLTFLSTPFHRDVFPSHWRALTVSGTNAICERSKRISSISQFDNSSNPEDALGISDKPFEVYRCMFEPRTKAFLRFNMPVLMSSRRLFSTTSSFKSSQSSHSLDDYYEILGITPEASQKEFKAAYIAKSKLYHPDNNAGKEAEAQEKFIKVAAAFKTLSSRRHRSEYDVDLGMGYSS